LKIEVFINMEPSEKEKQEFRKFKQLLLAYDEAGEWYASVEYDRHQGDEIIEWDNMDTYLRHGKENIKMPSFVESYFYKNVEEIVETDFIYDSSPETETGIGGIYFTIDTRGNTLTFVVEHGMTIPERTKYETTIQDVLKEFVHEPEEHRSELMDKYVDEVIEDIDFDGSDGYSNFHITYGDSLVWDLVHGTFDKFDLSGWDEEYGATGKIIIDYPKNKITVVMDTYTASEMSVTYKKYKF
jgi:hypothetical protein